MTGTSGATRLRLAWSPWLRPLGWLIAGAPSRSWVEVEPDKVTASFGSLGWAAVPRERIVRAARRGWPRSYGYGVRRYEQDGAGFVGRRDRVVELTLDPPVEVKAVLPRLVRRLALSPEQPERLLALLEETPGPRE
jgi:hypothetical protein